MGLGVEKEELDALFAQGKADSEYLMSILPELHKKYPGYYVAVYDRKVVAVSRCRKRLRRLLRKRGVPRGRAKIEFMEIKPVPWIL